jgi:hypothetical protein
MNHLIGIKLNKSDFDTFILTFIFLFGSFNIKAQKIVPDSLVKERIRYIQNILSSNRTNANRWYYGWLAGYSAATVGQGTVFFLSNDKVVRQNMALGAATTCLGALGQLLTPMDPGQKADILSQISDSTQQDRLKKLTSAEELLNSAALREKFGRSWQAHTLCGVVNLSSGLVTWLGFKQSIQAGIINFALNSIITEAQIWTQPTKIMKDYHNYCNSYISGLEPKVNNPKLVCYVSAYPGGIAIRVLF